MIKRIAIVGNAGGGKTTLARQLAKLNSLPLTHVDSIQFLAGMKIRPHADSIQMLKEIQKQDSWIIEGFGPLDIIEARFALADRIVFIDFPIWRHYFWCAKRQIKSIWAPRSELPEGCSDLSFAQTLKLFQNVKKVHEKMRPELLNIFSREALSPKMVWIRNFADWQKIFNNFS